MATADIQEIPGLFGRPERWRGHEIIDCDVHVNVPGIRALFPYLEPRWQDYIVESGTGGLDSSTYPRGAALSARPGSVPEDGGPPGSDLDLLRRDVLTGWGTRYAVLNCDYGIPVIHNEDWADAMARAVNDWQAAEWLGPESRLRGSIVVPPQNPERAVDEIDRLGDRPAFVQVLLPARSEAPLGKRRYWPLYEAAARHRLAIGVYAGGAGWSPITAVGWPTYYLEDYVDFAQAFQAQVLSLVSEGVFTKFPDLRVVLLESGFTWMSSLMWRFDKNWLGLRREVPWVTEPPSDVIRRHIRLTTQPLDEPPENHHLLQLIDQLRGDHMLLFSTDYPHWHFDAGDEALPHGLAPELEQRILAGNARDTYRFD